MERITTPEGVVLIINDDDTFTLGVGSPVNPTLGKSASEAVKNLRSAEVDGDNKTRRDLVFASLSALASFVRGAQTNGKAYFASDLAKAGIALGSPAKHHRQPAEEKAQQQPAEEAKPDNADGTLSKAQMQQANAVAQKVMTFCKDFEFKPDPRLINTLRHLPNATEAGEFIVNTMELIGMPVEIIDSATPKFKSPEWREIFAEMKACPVSHGKINQRLAIYYGPAGTGKTTLAEQLYKCPKIIASPTQDPSELFTRNVVNDHGGVDLVLTEIGQAITEGKPIIIDEANLYQSVVLQRLQGVTDGGKSFVDNGREIEIADGFKVIMTLNLETNYGKTPLPNPLVSRAGEIVKMDKPFLGWVF